MVIHTNKKNLNNSENQEPKMEVNDYEQVREERMRENLDRMQKLGILDLSLKLKSLKSTPKSNRPSPRRTTPQSHSHSVLPPSSGPIRRSSRLQNSTPVSYMEVHLTKKDKSLDDGDLLREVGSKPEVYTEEHEKLLGSTERSWTPFVDGYGKDGKRIYDPVRGKTCHQCRQKTLGYRTHCSTCNLVQGQFCGDCLYMRYGEHVLEANENPDWICPVCRGICNCSLCRQAKGWAPTGALYRKISSLGYKSVAHYLVQTRHANTDSDKNVATKIPGSAKRSLPFSDVEVTPGKNDLSISNNENLKSDPGPEVDGSNDDITNKVADETHSKEEVIACGEMAPEPEAKPLLETVTENFGSACNKNKEANPLVDHKLDKSYSVLNLIEVPLTDPLLNESSNQNQAINPERGDDYKMKKDEAIIEDNGNSVAPEESPKSTKKCVAIVSTPDSIAGRLKRRRIEDNETDPLLTESSNQNQDINPERCDDNETEKDDAVIEDNGNSVALEKSPKSTKKNCVAIASTPDSIAGRLKRRRMA